MLKECFNAIMGLIRKSPDPAETLYTEEQLYAQYMLQYGPGPGCLTLPMAAALFYTEHPSREFKALEIRPPTDSTIIFVIRSGDETDMFSYVVAVDWETGISGTAYVLGSDMRHIDGQVNGSLSISMSDGGVLVGDLVTYWRCDGTGIEDISFVITSRHPWGADLYYVITSDGIQHDTPVFLPQLSKIT